MSDDVPAPLVPPAPGTARPTVRVGMVTVDTRDARALGSWWAARTGGRLEAHDGFVMVHPATPGGVTLGFQQVADPTPGKNRAHLDLATDDVAGFVDACLAAGATLVGDHTLPDGFAWTVLADPEGNQFCVSPAHGS